MEELLVYTTIASYEGEEKYKLTVGIEEDGTYYMPSLTFISKSGLEVYYDNEEYIFNELYNVLDTWFTEKKVTDLDTLVETLKSIPVEDFQVVLDILNKGLQLGFYKRK